MPGTDSHDRGAPARRSGKLTLQGAELGIELAAALIGFTLVGLWIDQSFGTSPWALVVCLVLGLVGGFYNFIRSSLSILRRPPSPNDRVDRND
ncbi:MAG: AtpZ/AtpI family protein [Acidobacteriota bacterium]